MRFPDRNGYSIVCLKSSEELWRRLLKCTTAMAHPAEFNLVRAPAEPAQLIETCGRLAPALLVVEEADFDALPRGGMREQINRGDVRILVLASGPTNVLCESLLRKGCSGVLSMEAGDATLRKAAQSILAGELWAPRRVLSSFAKETLSRDRSKELTQREADIHKLICLGLTNRQIADQLFISRETVRWHVRSLYSKLGVPNQRQAMLEAGSCARTRSTPVLADVQEALLS